MLDSVVLYCRNNVIVFQENLRIFYKILLHVLSVV